MSVQLNNIEAQVIILEAKVRQIEADTTTVECLEELTRLLRLLVIELNP